MHLPALLFSLLAAVLVAVSRRRDPSSAPRLAATAILLLLAFPLLDLLPKLPLLPAIVSDSIPTATTPTLISATWLAVAAILTLRILIAGLTLLRWRNRSRLLGITSGGVELRLLHGLGSPVAAGIFRPVVFLPAAWPSWQPEVREMILTHELAHHRRRDPLWRTLGAMACAIYWFNPLVWWLARRHAAESEFACDLMVVDAGASPDRYATMLCDLARPGRMPATVAAITGRSGLRTRVERLMNPPGSSSAVVSTALLLTAVVAAVTFSLLCPAAPPVPSDELRLRLTADPFPGN